jgi:1-acyl-sn-glycerol-3-phosphate acyltransferase
MSTPVADTNKLSAGGQVPALDSPKRDAKNRREGPSAALPSLSWAARLRSNAIQAPLFVLATSGFGSFSILLSLFDKSGKWQHRTAQVWARVMLLVAASPLTVINGEVYKTHPVAVYASNHLSYMDTPVMFASLPFQFRILARHNLWKLPFIGWYLQRSGQIPVNADNPRASISSLNVGVKALKAGMPLVVFPEGGRAVDGQLQSFMSGPAFMAIRAQVPLIPMALIGTHELFPMHTWHFRPRPVKVVIGTPLSTDGLTTRDANSLTERLRAEVSRLYYESSDVQLPKPPEFPDDRPSAYPESL